MQIDISFQGPASEELFEIGAIDITPGSYDRVYYGKGENRAVAAVRACLAIANCEPESLLAQVLKQAYESLPPEALMQEADGITHDMYCVIKVKE